MKEQLLAMIESLEGKKDNLTLDELGHAMDLFESGLSGELVARILVGEFNVCG